MQLDQIYNLASGLNIEGGRPYHDLIKHSPDAKWINLVLVLDTPLTDNINFNDIFSNNKYPLLENAIQKINEHQLLSIYLAIISYYFDNAKNIFPFQEKIKIMIHLHQFPSCQPLIEIISQYLKMVTIDLSIEMTNIFYDFITDTPTYQETLPDYEKVDILISLSQCAGLDENIPAGELIIPHIFIPYNITEKKIYSSKKYTASNILEQDILQIVNSKYFETSCRIINQNYKSANESKRDHLASIENINFHYKPLLQVQELWNPDNKKEIIEIV